MATKTEELIEKLKGRLLTADEIEVRVGRVTPEGVSVLFYKDARADQNVLDEIFGPFGWQNKYYAIGNNLHCVISIWDEEKQQWIAKDNRGTVTTAYKEKGEASDAFKRAGFCLGIGRELYSLRETFIPADLLWELNTNYCGDKFTVLGVESEAGTSGKKINSITIGIAAKGVMHHSITFSRTAPPVMTTLEAKPPVSESAPATQAATPKEEVSATPETLTETRVQGVASAPVAPIAPATPAASAPAAPTAPTGGFADNEVILIGNCRGKKYGDVKDSKAFKSFLNWVKTSSISYPEADKNAQLERFRALAATA